MAEKRRIKKGDEVMVRTGRDRGKVGEVLKITGGNGSDGVRRQGTAADQGAFAINTALTDAYANLDLGTANTGLATEKHVLVRFGLADGKSVTAISVEDWS